MRTNCISKCIPTVLGWSGQRGLINGYFARYRYGLNVITIDIFAQRRVAQKTEIRFTKEISDFLSCSKIDLRYHDTYQITIGTKHINSLSDIEALLNDSFVIERSVNFEFDNERKIAEELARTI